MTSKRKRNIKGKLIVLEFGIWNVNILVSIWNSTEKSQLEKEQHKNENYKNNKVLIDCTSYLKSQVIHLNASNNTESKFSNWPIIIKIHGSLLISVPLLFPTDLGQVLPWTQNYAKFPLLSFTKHTCTSPRKLTISNSLAVIESKSRYLQEAD